jgi:RNA polymerase sigma-70 factor (ECF subfamily)
MAATTTDRVVQETCLTTLESRTRRPLPRGLGAPSEAAEEPLRAPATDVPWLQPLPDALIDPATVVAAFLGTSTAAVKSTLQRARARLDEVAPDEDLVVEPEGAADREVLDRYVAAFENADMEALVELLQDGVELEMPPYLEWFGGRKNVLRFLEPRVGEKGLIRMLPTRANGQPAAAMYKREADGVYRAHAMQVLTVSDGAVARMTVFIDPGLFDRFGMPEVVT